MQLPISIVGKELPFRRDQRAFLLHFAGRCSAKSPHNRSVSVPQKSALVTSGNSNAESSAGFPPAVLRRSFRSVSVPAVSPPPLHCPVRQAAGRSLSYEEVGQRTDEKIKSSSPKTHFIRTRKWNRFMDDQNISKIISLDRIDLDFRSKVRRFAGSFEEFLQMHRIRLGLSDSQDLISEWLEHNWPDGEKSRLIITKLSPEDGKTFWSIRPLLPDIEHSASAGESQLTVGSQIPSFKVEEYGGHLIVQGFAPDLQRPPGSYDFVFEGNVFVDARRGEMSPEDLELLRGLPHYAPSSSSRFAKWQNYLDWREKVTEDNSKHRYAYKDWELRKEDAEVRFFLSEPQPIDLLKVRLQGQQLIAVLPGLEITDAEAAAEQGTRRRGSKTPTAGSFQSIFPLQGGQHRQPGSGKWPLRNKPSDLNSPQPATEKVAVNVRLSNEQRRKLKENAITRDELFPSEGELAVDVSGEMAALRNQRQAIERLEQGKTVNQRVVEWVFDSQKARVAEHGEPVEFDDKRLNEGQKTAVQKALAAPDLFLLQGPPGTGKTTVIAELCRQTAKREQRVLIASQANLAVDNALSCVFPTDCRTPNLRPLRLLDPRREGDMEEGFKRFLRTQIVSCWLESVARASEAKTSQAERGDADARWADIQRKWILRLKSKPPADQSDEMQKLYVRHANVVGVTCNQSGKKDFYHSVELDTTFDLVIVDEVSKATPPELLMPLLLGRRSVLVGDHRQLPPMFRSDSFEEAVANDELKAEDLERFNKLVTASLFEELFTSAPEQLRHTLREQYRMHPHIMDAVNHFYPDKDGNGMLLPGGGREDLHNKRQHGLTVRGSSGLHLLKTTDNVLWVDSSVDERGREISAAEEKRGTSRLNSHEVDLIENVLKFLDENEVVTKRSPKLDVGVISFYMAQTNELRERLVRKAEWRHLDVQVNTVDQFQGRECSVVIVSLVRSGDVSGEFVKDYRRINVAFSRAKQLLIIVGSRRAFDRAVVPIAPVEGGDARAKNVYQEIAQAVAKRGGLRTASNVQGKSVVGPGKKSQQSGFRNSIPIDATTNHRRNRSG
jgi:hypothetical protein